MREQFSYVTAVRREPSSTKGVSYPAIFPLPFAVRRLESGRYYGSGNGRGDDVAWLVTGRNINALR